MRLGNPSDVKEELVLVSAILTFAYSRFCHVSTSGQDRSHS
jgi:hypothetical protein